MLTSRCAGTPSASWSAAPFGAAIILSVMSVMTWTPAQAGGFSDWSCVGGWKGFNCVERWGPAIDPYVRLVPQPLGEAEKERVLVHERKWLARCHPVLAHDRYGVARYHYSASGCEFGVDED